MDAERPRSAQLGAGTGEPGPHPRPGRGRLWGQIPGSGVDPGAVPVPGEAPGLDPGAVPGAPRGTALQGRPWGGSRLIPVDPGSRGGVGVGGRLRGWIPVAGADPGSRGGSRGGAGSRGGSRGGAGSRGGPGADPVPPWPRCRCGAGVGRSGRGQPGSRNKRLCRLLDTIPGEAAAQLVDCAMDLEPRQKLLPDSAPWAAKAKQNSMILENHGSKGISQPCPRCVAGESGVSQLVPGRFPAGAPQAVTHHCHHRKELQHCLWSITQPCSCLPALLRVLHPLLVPSDPALLFPGSALPQCAPAPHTQCQQLSPQLRHTQQSLSSPRTALQLQPQECQEQGMEESSLGGWDCIPAAGIGP
ncbi:uncharacterized protein C10orf143 homolog isoform X1 [Agelaius tricolor]|uniref:uncharacterized protein C10orf143 homolog isoform X1 n=1 Tax=Agelaius tricolor TaxID=9191 RepID=UPI0039F228FD